jgi:hypothetical protein
VNDQNSGSSCDLLNDALTVLGFVASNVGMIGECGIGRDVEGNCRGLM